MKFLTLFYLNRSKPVEDPTNRFYIGEAFLVKENETEAVFVPEEVLKSPPPPPPPLETFPEIETNIKSSKKTGKVSKGTFDITPDDLVDEPVQVAAAASAPPTPKLEEQIRDEVAHLQNLNAAPVDMGKYCKLCDISVTSEMHMRLHLAGAKHAKKLRQLGEPPYSEVPHTLSQCVLEDTKTTKRPQTANVNPDTVTALDFSVFRTPSGQYYCQVCDLSVTSEVTLGQHFLSKRHLKAVKRK